MIDFDQNKKKVRVAAGILWRNARFLAAKRPEGKERAGFWEFPGGKQEPGEEIEDTLRRELKEELDVCCGKLLPLRTCPHEYEDLCVELHFIHVLDFSGEPKSNDGQELRWVSREEALSLEFLPADKAVIDIIYPPEELKEFEES